MAVDVLTVGPAADEVIFARVGVANPNLMVGAGPWRQMVRQAVGQRLHVVVHRIVAMRRGTGHYSWLDIATGGQRRMLDRGYVMDWLMVVLTKNDVNVHA